MVRLPAMNPAQKLTFLSFTSAEGKGAPLPFRGPSQSFGFSLFPLPMSGDLRSLSTNICLSSLWPTFLPNGHLFDGLILSILHGRIVSVLPLRLRGLSRDTTYFLVDPFEFPYYFYRIRGELIYVLFIVVCIPSTFCPTLGHHQGRIYYKSYVTFVLAYYYCGRVSLPLKIMAFAFKCNSIISASS